MATGGGHFDARMCMRARMVLAAATLVLAVLTYVAAVWVLSLHRLPEQPLVPISSFQNPSGWPAPASAK